METRPSEEASVPPVKARSRWLVKSFLILILLLVALAAASLQAFKIWGRRPYGAPGKKSVKIPHGAPLTSLADQLEKDGIVSNGREFVLLTLLSGKKGTIQAGDYEFTMPISPLQTLDRLGHGTFLRKLTIPEGWTARQIEKEMIREHLISAEGEWAALVSRPVPAEYFGEPLPAGAEGFCFPDTYAFEEGASAESILNQMLHQFGKVWKPLAAMERDPRSRELTLLEVVTLASIIEREARRPEEMPRMASVFLNRLRKKIKLQSCATVHYALGEVWDRALNLDDLKVDSPFNTYRIAGLPSGPIGNPGRPALESVLHPAATDDFFFVYRGDGTHEFTKTYKEHMKAAKKFLHSDPTAEAATE